MNATDATPRALFLTEDGRIYADDLICSGEIPPELAGQPCPFADAGRMPTVTRLAAGHPRYTVDQGRPGDFCPPCAKQQLGYLGHWEGYRGRHFPGELLGLRVFRCRLLFWLVVPGLYDHTPDRIEEAHENGELPPCAL